MSTLTVCSVGDCGKVSTRRGYCPAHYYRWRRELPLEAPVRERQKKYKKGTPCSFDRCGRPIIAHKLCQMHYQRQKKGLPLEGAPKVQAGKGRSRTGEGYIRLTVPIGTPGSVTTGTRRKVATMLEHRYLMQKHLERPLLRTETIHHKDGNRSNNDITNLELKVSAHGAGITARDGALAHIAFLERYTGLDLSDRAFLARLRDKAARGSIGVLEVK